MDAGRARPSYISITASKVFIDFSTVASYWYSDFRKPQLDSLGKAQLPNALSDNSLQKQVMLRRLISVVTPNSQNT